MKKPTSVNTLETLGRVRLSESFFMRDFLYSEISQIEGIANIPDDPDLAIFVGKQLCENVLEPIQAALGQRIAHVQLMQKVQRIKINIIAPRMKLTMQAIFGIKKMLMVVWGQRLVLLSIHLFLIMNVQASGRP